MTREEVWSRCPLTHGALWAEAFLRMIAEIVDDDVVDGTSQSPRMGTALAYAKGGTDPWSC